MTDNNGLNGKILRDIRYQQMLFDEKDMYKEDFALMKETRK